MSDVQDTLDKLNSNNVSIAEIKRSLNSTNILIKSNAILNVIRLDICDDEVICQLIKIAMNINNESHVLGLWNNGHFAVAALKLIDTKMSLDKYQEALTYLNDTQKEDVNRLINEWPT